MKTPAVYLTVRPSQNKSKAPFSATVKAEHGFYEWDLMATFNVAGRPKHREIRLNDKPFRVTGLPTAGHATAFEWAWFLPDSRFIPEGTESDYF